MIHTILHLFYIQLIIVMVTDMSDWWDTIQTLISKWLGLHKQVHLRIMECSFCQLNWIGLLYLLITHSFSFGAYGIVLVMAYFNPVVQDTISTIRDILTTIINYINKKLS